MTIREKYERLNALLRQNPGLAIAYSGGVDSSFLLKAAVDALGRNNVVAVTVRAANFPARETAEAEAFARSLGVHPVFLDLEVMAIPGFAENSPERCYFCKKAVFSAIREAAGKQGATILADGANVDDDGDYRPGTRAVRELGAISPLREAGLTKADIRALAREMNLPFWDKPSFACLASRIPYNHPISAEAMARVERAEQYFLASGLRNVRVRLHGDLARVEVEPADMPRFFDVATLCRMDADLRAMGFAYAALDMRGYRTGSMNETLSLER